MHGGGPKGLSQQELAPKLDLKPGTVSEYLSLAKQPVEIQDIIGRPINLGTAPASACG